MQVVMDEAEYELARQTARRRGLTLAEWVRQVLRRAARLEPTGDVERKLSALRAAVRHSFPTGEIDELLSDIESGYLDENQA
jgi:hypothetical protein